VDGWTRALFSSQILLCKKKIPITLK
jgi:hypothetical protein